MQVNFRKAVAAIAIIAMLVPGAAQAQHMDFTAIVAGIGGGNFFKAAEEVSDAASVSVVRLSTLAGANLSGLASAVSLKGQAIRYLQREASYNPFARQAINGAGVSLSQIVAALRVGRDEIILFADDL